MPAERCPSFAISATPPPAIGRSVSSTSKRIVPSIAARSRAPVDDVIEPNFADLRRRQVAAVAVIRQDLEERERAGDIVVGDDQHTVLDRGILALMHVVR